MSVALLELGSGKYLKADLALECPRPGLGAQAVGRVGGAALGPCVDFPHEVACASRERNVRGTFPRLARASGRPRRDSGDPCVPQPTHTPGAATVGFPAERRSCTLTVRAVSCGRLIPLNFPGAVNRRKAPV